MVNTLSMLAFGMGSRLTLFKLHNVLANPNAYGGTPDLPYISMCALRFEWVCFALPAISLFTSAVIFAALGKNDQQFANAVQLHTSLTILVGVVMLGAFLMAGVLPFVPMISRFN